MTYERNKRDSGIAIVGDLPWGSHFCQFYRTREDILNILVPYFIAGLKNNEACVWVTSDFLTTQDAINAMKERTPDVLPCLSKGQIEIFPYTDWYLKGEKFDLQRTLDMWMKKHDEALSRGFEGLRVSGDPYWINNKEDWDDFASYEAEINRTIGGTNLIVLCTYSLEKCGVVEIMDVIKNHEFALAVNHGEWQLVRIPGFTLTLQKIRRRKALRSRKIARTKGVLTFFKPHLGCTKLRPKKKVPRALISSLFSRFRSTFFATLRFSHESATVAY